MEKNQRNLKSITPLDGARVFLFAIIINLGIQIFASIVIVGVRQVNDIDFTTNVIFNFVLMLIIQIAFVSVYYSMIAKKSMALDIDYKHRPKKLSLVLAVLLALLSILAFYAPTIWFGVLLDKIGYTISSIPQMETVPEFILGVFVLVIAAPIGEELIFRGALLSGLKKKLGERNAVLLTALAFTVMHMNAGQTAYQFLLGVVMGFAAIYSGSVLVPMIIHSASNLLAFLLEYTALLNLADGFVNMLSGNILVAVLVSLLFVAVFGTLIYLVLRKIRQKKVEPDNVQSGSLELTAKPLASRGATDNDLLTSSNPTFVERAYKPVFWLAMGLCMFMWIVDFITSVTS